MYALGCPLFQCAGLRLRIDIEIVLRGFQLAGLILLRVDFPNSHDSTEKIMLHLIWYVIVGFLAGCVAKSLMHTHLSITWTVVLGIVGSIIGGAVTHLFYHQAQEADFIPAV